LLEGCDHATDCMDSDDISMSFGNAGGEYFFETSSTLITFIFLGRYTSARFFSSSIFYSDVEKQVDCYSLMMYTALFRYLEAVAKGRTSDAITKLMNLQVKRHSPQILRTNRLSPATAGCRSHAFRGFMCMLEFHTSIARIIQCVGDYCRVGDDQCFRSC
jgi:hypothetical protein